MKPTVKHTFKKKPAKRADGGNPIIDKLLKLKYRINDTAITEDGWSDDMSNDKRYVQSLIMISENISSRNSHLKMVIVVMDYGGNMSKQEILDRIWNVLNQGVDTESQDLDLLRHDLENDIIAERKFQKECG